MSKVIPSKMANFGKAPKGVMNMRDVETTMVKLLPNNASSTQEYSTTGTSRISFRIPNYANSFMDNSRSFLSYKFTNTTTIPGSGTMDCRLVDQPGAWISRLVVKSNGLTLEDTTNYNLLCKLFKLMDVRDEAGKVHLADHSTLVLTRPMADTVDDVSQKAIATATRSGQYYVFEFESGILSKHLRSYLPLHLMSHSASALDIDIYLAEPKDCMQYVKTGSTVSSTTGLVPGYKINDIVYNLCLVKVDEGLCKKFNQIACSETENLIVPYTTFRNHTATQSAQRQTVFVSEACTDLQRLYVMWVSAQTNTPTVGKQPNEFVGAVHNAANDRLVSYNVRVGNKYVWNEAVMEERSNHISLQHFIDAHYLGTDDKTMFVQNWDRTESTPKTFFESGRDFVVAANLTYSDETDKGVVQGINTGGLPVQIEAKFEGDPNLTVHSFAQCGYELHIKHGQVTYVEVRSGDDTSY